MLRRLAVRLCRLLTIWRDAAAAPPGVRREGFPDPVIFRSALLRHAVSGRAPPLLVRG
ncbi:hypothetical protein [Streptosporangium sp. NPDC000396]|uniref:hypothetical protein n=1 Tax=Streptosporangium sp. NPDC000396 TaxID=3366185 RepID=UPI00369F45C9